MPISTKNQIPSLKTAPQIPSRRALAGLAVVTVLSTIEKRRKQQEQGKEGDKPPIQVEDMSGELQTIPARHGVATFVPRGRTIKVINTYGKQVVSMWAFTLGAPPEDGDEDGPGAEEIEKAAKELQEAAEKDEGQGEKQEIDGPAEEESSAQKSLGQNKGTTEQLESSREKVSEEKRGAPSEHAPETPDNEKATEGTAKSIKDTAGATETSAKQPSKRTWASYLPSIPYRSKGKGDKAEKAEAGAEQEPSPEEQKAQDEANTKKWSSYMPTGKGFSSYMPNVEVPSREGVVSAFKSSHYRDPNKSYAEQLYDFSKTPVGAGTIAAATGSGYASSVYAVYSAYAQTHPLRDDRPPMEYLSLPHTRASSYKLVPEVDDTLLTNLRNPIVTLVEDTSPGAHDTLTAACDANLYASLGVDKPAEHGSCAENLVLALKELNENAGLKGAKAVGADISVNIAPTPLHLFMVAPIDVRSDAKTAEAGAKGARLAVEEPRGKKRCFVRFRAERDVVVVFSACPNEVGPQNGGRCMAANFMVEDAEADDQALKSGSEKKIQEATPQRAQETKTESAPTKAEDKADEKADDKGSEERSDAACEDSPKPRKKPKKLEVRSKQ
ncbi:uncharacterized protein M421DRAFT_97079 [Didymella exigua CBS 183.55]|uniref:DUF1989 domain-containing protein n=1 Tax=Didymella exigua CBS 183.55 TaxID=1150837 RepID=A0A6A5S1T3_9PLEO|nr:uncharacterized protein M421DRAFT_97079 [Didymella exigua CBS 183.55]KAF1934082.1 hypothetical protein M421DRAFT_97079 [Didymella exigua CBS 183.55]